MMLNLGMTLSDGTAANGALSLPAPVPPPDPVLPTPPPPQEQAAGAYSDGSGDSNALQQGTMPPSEEWKPVFEPGSAGASTVPMSGNSSGSTDDFNYLIRTLAAHGRCREARTRIVPEMRRRGVRLNRRTYSALLAGTAVEKDPAAAEEVRTPLGKKTAGIFLTCTYIYIS